VKIAQLIQRLPKCELHIHIEGSLEPELMFALARRNGVSLRYPSVAALRQAYQFRNLQDFLDIYYQGMSVLITEQDFYDLAFAYLERARADNVQHVEMFFDPQGHTSRGVPFATVVAGLDRAIREAKGKLGIKASLIMCFLRHLDAADAEKTLDSALSFETASPVSGSILPRTDTRQAGSRRSSGARATPASFSPPMRARKARHATSGKRSTCLESRASIMAIVPSRTQIWLPGSRASR
jgi:adenosine deaminase